MSKGADPAEGCLSQDQLAELMQRAIENGWTVRKWEEEKVSKQSRRPPRGGSLQSIDLQTDLARLTQKTRRLCRLADAVWRDGTIGYLSQRFPEEERMFSLLGPAKKVMRQLIERLEKRRLAPEILMATGRGDYADAAPTAGPIARMSHAMTWPMPCGSRRRMPYSRSRATSFCAVTRWRPVI